MDGNHTPLEERRLAAWRSMLARDNNYPAAQDTYSSDTVANAINNPEVQREAGDVHAGTRDGNTRDGNIYRNADTTVHTTSSVHRTSNSITYITTSSIFYGNANSNEHNDGMEVAAAQYLSQPSDYGNANFDSFERDPGSLYPTAPENTPVESEDDVASTMGETPANPLANTPVNIPGDSEYYGDREVDSNVDSNEYSGVDMGMGSDLDMGVGDPNYMSFFRNMRNLVDMNDMGGTDDMYDADDDMPSHPHNAGMIGHNGDTDSNYSSSSLGGIYTPEHSDSDEVDEFYNSSLARHNGSNGDEDMDDLVSGALAGVYYPRHNSASMLVQAGNTNSSQDWDSDMDDFFNPELEYPPPPVYTPSYLPSYREAMESRPNGSQDIENSGVSSGVDSDVDMMGFTDLQYIDGIEPEHEGTEDVEDPVAEDAGDIERTSNARVLSAAAAHVAGTFFTEIVHWTRPRDAAAVWQWAVVEIQDYNFIPVRYRSALCSIFYFLRCYGIFLVWSWVIYVWLFMWTPQERQYGSIRGSSEQ